MPVQTIIIKSLLWLWASKMTHIIVLYSDNKPEKFQCIEPWL